MDKKFYKKKLENQKIILEQYKKEIDSLKQKIDFLESEVYKDSLTNLYNRKIIDKVIDYDSLILGDIDFFKIINDKYGHDMGDKVLIEISRIFQENISESDIACRWGGEEFILFLKESDEKTAKYKAEIIQKRIEELEKVFNFRITMSFGISTLKDKEIHLAIKEADKALYHSKNNGRNKVTVYQLKY